MTVSVFVACPPTPEEPEFENPTNPDDPGFTPPETNIVFTHGEGAILDTHAVTIIFQGNDTRMEFRHRLKIGRAHV